MTTPRPTGPKPSSSNIRGPGERGDRGVGMPTRRRTAGTIAAVGACLFLAAACGDDDDTAGPSDTTSTTTTGATEEAEVGLRGCAGSRELG